MKKGKGLIIYARTVKSQKLEKLLLLISIGYANCFSGAILVSYIKIHFMKKIVFFYRFKSIITNPHVPYFLQCRYSKVEYYITISI